MLNRRQLISPEARAFARRIARIRVRRRLLGLLRRALRIEAVR